MSPEQARGQVVDKRTDIWAFGCVLFEMLTGQAAVGGTTLSDTIAAILEREPVWDRLPATTPQNISLLLRRCLDKDPKRRLHDMGDARLEIDHALREPVRASRAAWPSRRSGVLAWSLVAITAAAAIVLAGLLLRRDPTTEARPIRFSVSPADFVGRRGLPTLSPDGRRLAFVAAREGVPVVWVRSLDAVEAQPLSGSEDAVSAFWSPDSRSLGFFTVTDGLKIVDEIGGPARTLGPILGRGFYGAMWSPDGRIIVGSLTRGLWAISAAGGSPPTQFTRFDSAHGEGGQLFPTMLPDGRHFLYLSEPSGSIWLAALESKDTIRLMSADSQAVYVPPGYLLFVRRQTLFAQPFDPQGVKVAGEPIPIAEGVLTEQLYGADFTASQNGVLAYRTGTLHVRTQLAWVDRTGKRLGTVGPPGRYANIELSPDGRRVVLEALDPRSYTKDIWIMDLGRGVLSQLTFDSGNETFPIWSPDGRWIMFASDREGGWQLYQRRADGAGGDERVVTSVEAIVPQSWAPDGRSVLYLFRPSNLGVLPLVGTRTPRLFDPAIAEGSGRNDGHGQVSPDGQWVTYASNETGQFQVYVQSYPMPGGGKWQVSNAGGFAPRWRADGREIFYYALDGSIVGVPVTIATEGKVGVPLPLFKAKLLGGPVSAIPWRMQYAVTADGQRFLLDEPLEDVYAHAPITVVTNWMATVKK
jgi:eukaryotic-like serine/threonine-protein kinase